MMLEVVVTGTSEEGRVRRSFGEWEGKARRKWSHMRVPSRVRKNRGKGRYCYGGRTTRCMLLSYSTSHVLHEQGAYTESLINIQRGGDE